MIFLLLYYRLLGAVAVLGLAVYGVFFFALVKLIPITLTLPGIAGLVLTIGVAADANIVIFERIKEEARAGRSPLSAIAQGYRKGIATIIDANVITLFTAFILFVLATAGVKGFAFMLGVGTLVSLFTAVLFTQAVLGRSGAPRRSSRHGRSAPARSGPAGTSTSAGRAGGSSRSPDDPDDRRDLVRDQPAEPRHRLHLGLQDHGEPPEARLRSTRCECAGEGRGGQLPSAEIQSVDNPKLGQNVVQIQSPTSSRTRCRRSQDGPRERLRPESPNGFDKTTVGPTFGAQVASSAIYAIIFSLLVICAYMAFRFEPKYAVPVIIAVIHDILITGASTP